MEETLESIRILTYHGGNLDVAKRLFTEAPHPWIDLSTGINAHAYPVGMISPEAWTRLPEASAVAALEVVAAAAYGLNGGEAVAAPGTQSLIQLLPRLINARSVGILGFTYGEYARIWRQAGLEAQNVETLDALAGFDLAIVVNPNNPDGRRVATDELVSLAAKLGAHGGTLLVDEAFMDFYRIQASLAPHLPDNALIFRSFGKTYGLAGLRLGFVLAKNDLAHAFRRELGPWAVSGPAIEIATRALADKDWLVENCRRLLVARARLEALLTGAGFDLMGGTHLFVLASHVQAQHWFRHLAKAGILVRPFAHQPQWLRFGLPETQDWPRVEAALQSG
jgi:cobalamin biosynthesis protein CobC